MKNLALNGADFRVDMFSIGVIWQIYCIHWRRNCCHFTVLSVVVYTKL